MSSKLVRRTEFNDRVFEALLPFKSIILFVDHVLLWEKPLYFVILFLFMQGVIWGTNILLESFTIVTLTAMFLAVGLLGLRLMRFPPSINVPLPDAPSDADFPRRHEYDEIVGSFVSTSCAILEACEDFYEGIHEKKREFIRAMLVLVLIGYAGTVFSTFTCTWVFINFLLILPGWMAHRLHEKAQKQMQPHMDKALVMMDPHLQQAKTTLTPHLTKAQDVLKPHWEKIQPTAAPYIEQARDLAFGPISSAPACEVPSPAPETPSVVESQSSSFVPEEEEEQEPSSFTEQQSEE